MATEILTDKDTNQSVMICNTSEMAFGPVFGENENPLDFIGWCEEDGYREIRSLSSEHLSNLVDRWRKEVFDNESEASITTTFEV